MKFRATVELGGKTATGIQVPEQVVEGLGSGKRPRVRVTINGYTHVPSIGCCGEESGIVSGSSSSLR